jgi:hypothetical protein
MRRTRTTLAALTVALSVLTTSAGQAAAPTLGDRVRAALIDAALAANVDPDVVLSSPAELEIWYTDGPSETWTTTIGDTLEMMLPEVPTSIEGEGPLGTPEIFAGNTTHVFGDLYAGSTSGAVCNGITVTDSALAPETPFAPVTGAPLFLTPVPGALSPVIPASSWILPAYSAGGKTRHVKGTYNTLGLHTVGTLVGSGASTASGAPAPSPVWLPMVHTLGLVEDRSIDFLGHALVFQAKFRVDAFGYTICTAVGGMLLSDGVAIFDNHKVLGVEVAFPDIP